MRLGRDDFKVRRWPLIVRSHQSTTRERCPPPPAPLPFYDWCRRIFRVSPARFPVSFFFLLLAPIDFGDTTSRIVWWIPAIFDRTAMEMSSDCDCRLLSRYWIPFHPISNANESRFLFSCLFLFPMFFFLASFYNAETFLIRCDEKKNSFRSCHGAFLLEPMNSSHRHIDASSMPPPKSVRWISLPFASILFLFVCFVCFFFAVLYSFKFWGL